MSYIDAAEVGARIEELVARLSALDDTEAAARAQDLVRLLMSLYGAGLSRMLEIVRTEGGGPNAVVERLAADPLVASLLVLHDLHPDPVEVRITRALDRLQPHLPAHTRVVLVSVDEDQAHVVVERQSPGASAGETIALAIRRAIQEAAPEIGTVRIDGLDRALIQIARRPEAATP